MEDFNGRIQNVKYKYVKSKVLQDYYFVDEELVSSQLPLPPDNNDEYFQNQRLLNEIALQQNLRKFNNTFIQQKIMLQNIAMIDKLASGTSLAAAVNGFQSGIFERQLQQQNEQAIRTQKYHALWALPPAVNTGPVQRKSLSDINVDLVPEFYPRSYSPGGGVANKAPPMYNNKPNVGYYQGNNGGGGAYAPPKMSPDVLSDSVISDGSNQSNSSNASTTMNKGDIFDQMDKFPYGFMQQPLKQTKFYDTRLFCPFCKKNREPA
jgi:hypothetical protein